MAPWDGPLCPFSPPGKQGVLGVCNCIYRIRTQGTKHGLELILGASIPNSNQNEVLPSCPQVYLEADPTGCGGLLRYYRPWLPNSQDYLASMSVHAIQELKQMFTSTL